MSGTFHELVLGGVLVSPFVTYVAAALAVFLLLRPVLARVGFEDLFSAPPVALLSLYVVILALLIVLL
ncbi:DUF1656 domain-containing protein [Methylobacterium sp. NEAU 140]|uniref:DUF1656 domain-containing protein n=1 Tax=Methylobacterium sp. NEAU 140 TaxID=3064945 RepID=UPI0027339AF6|nr:DUF1656 domain-containing protein [Methylobacterium sp. NEAU 140]MDP4025933.1 DUF1656 domain-containing protein [Methylobacterium sp. NEAU 140]